MKRFRSHKLVEPLVLCLGIALAIALRLSLRNYLSQDFVGDFSKWYGAIREGGFAAIGTDISNYTPAYLYLLYLVSVLLPTVYAVTAVKIPPMLFDFACAWFVYRIVGMRYKDSPLPVLAFFAVLFAPSVVLNSSMWGQTDSIFTAMLVACMYFLMQKRGTAAALAFGVALSLKLQAVFLLPLLLALGLRGKIAWKSLALIPLVFLISLVPAWIAGRPPLELLRIYTAQAELNDLLTLYAPSLYAWLPENTYDVFLLPGLIFGGGMAYVYILAVWKSRAEITPRLLLRLGLLSAILLPFVLPKMHERYFYPADMLAIAYAFYHPRHYYVPIAINLISTFSYLPFFFMRRPVPLPFLSLGMLVLLVLVARGAMLDLYARKENP